MLRSGMSDGTPLMLRSGMSDGAPLEKPVNAASTPRERPAARASALREVPAAISSAPHGVRLEEIEVAPAAEEVILSSGRRYELVAGSDADELTVRSGAGQILLQIRVSDSGPILRFEAARVELRATERLELGAREVLIAAERGLALRSGGDLVEEVAGHAHERVAGSKRVEAASVELQASADSVRIRAMEGIALDGEHIGLNDDPCPQPFWWSAAAEAEERA
jgi:hypothetical protein